MNHARQIFSCCQPRVGWRMLAFALLAVTGWPAAVTRAANLVLGDHAARPGTTVNVPVFVPDATGVASVGLKLNFDPQILWLDGVTNGPLGAGFAVDYQVEDGRVTVAAVGESGLAGGSGNLLVLTFQVNAGALPGMSSPLVLADSGTSGEHGRDFAWTHPVSPTNGQVRVVSESFDSNQNGLPDWWEETYFGGPTSADPLADSDGDGMTNLQEFLAGTDPLDASSALRLRVVGREPGGLRLSFGSVAGRNYRLESSDNLTTWQPLGAVIPGTGEPIEVLDSDVIALPARFYRVALVP